MISPIPTLFLRDSQGKVIPRINPTCQWVLDGDGFTTIKLDGLHCRIVRNQSGQMVLEKGYTIQSGETFYVSVDMHLKVNAPYKEAWDNLVSTSFEGYYVVYGYGVKNNPHKLYKTQMIKVCPVSADLIIPEDVIVRGSAVSVEELYEKIKAELSDPATDVEGLVWHLEDAGVDIKAMAQVTKQDFGIKWGKG